MLRLFFQTILFFMLASSLTGCSIFFKDPPKPRVEYIVRDNYVPVLPADHMLTGVKPTKPFDKQEFIDANDSQRVLMLTKYNIEVLSDLAKANNNMKHLRLWKADQEALFIKK